MLVLATLVHGLAVAWLLGHQRPATGEPPPRMLTALPATPAPTARAEVPVGLVIPAIGLDESRLVLLGRNRDGTLEVPADYSVAGWFTGSPPPGTPGPAVIAGHVDSKSGPGVLFRLRWLRIHDVIIVRMSDSTRVRFTVDAVRDYPKSGFPTELVYGPVPGAALRLITCGGGFDRAAGSYRDNIVVYASLSV
jgi:hypothetical protein